MITTKNLNPTIWVTCGVKILRFAQKDNDSAVSFKRTSAQNDNSGVVSFKYAIAQHGIAMTLSALSGG